MKQDDSLQEQLRTFNVLTRWQDAILKERDNPFENIECNSDVFKRVHFIADKLDLEFETVQKVLSESFLYYLKEVDETFVTVKKEAKTMKETKEKYCPSCDNYERCVEDYKEASGYCAYYIERKY